MLKFHIWKLCMLFWVVKQGHIVYKSFKSKSITLIPVSLMTELCIKTENLYVCICACVYRCSQRGLKWVCGATTGSSCKSSMHSYY